MKQLFSLMFVLLLLNCSTFGAGNNGSNSVQLMDVHGAGAQRSDPKSGDPADCPEGHGPQGDVIRIFNYIRPVRGKSSNSDPYAVVDTGQVKFYNENAVTSKPAIGSAFYGQDAHYENLSPSYRDNGDGTVTDLNTGLTWQQDPGKKMGWSEAKEALKTFKLAGYTDWRLPTIKELYSLILFSGHDVSVAMQSNSYDANPFIDTDYFTFTYGDGNSNERIIDSQYMSSTKYVSTTMNGDETVFGVNFADGRIKGYPVSAPNGGEKEFYVIFVRGNTSYGKNNFVDNRDGTITDLATGLMWMQEDSGKGMNWENALKWVENLELAGYSDWRLPNAKELQSIVDYGRSPDTTNSPAIDPIFHCTGITDEGGGNNYPFYWTSTTHASSDGSGGSAVYLAFGEALGFMGPGGPQTQQPGEASNRQPPPPRRDSRPGR